ncbi:site-specific integrase [Phocaeicola sp.]
MGITLGKKQLNKGRVSLFLNYSYNGRRRKEYLGIILDAPTSAFNRAENRNKILIAKQIKAKKELEFLSVEYHLNDVQNTFDDILPTSKSNIPDFYMLMERFLDSYHGKDRKMVKACIMHLRLFTKKRNLPVNLLTKDFCVSFLEYLRDRLRGNTPIGYFKKFRMCIAKCVENKLMSSNPTDGIRLMQFDEVTKAILSVKEIQKLAVTSCSNNEVKRAFLFSCYCGLRWCDIYDLRYKDIDFPSQRLTVIQQKVQAHSKSAILHLNLNQTALKLLQKKKGLADEQVFDLPSYSYTLRVLNKWVKQANIQKHITFHCARHSFITNIMANGANIKTAANLAGHSTTRHTEKYVHIIDELKQKAVDSLPDIIVNY